MCDLLIGGMIVMNKKIIFIILLSLLFSPKTKLFAQLDSLLKDDRIRITASKYFYQPTVITFEKFQSDSLFFNMNTRTSAIPIQYLQKIELLKGKKRHTITGMISGAVFGGLILGISTKITEQNAEGFGKVGVPGFWGGFASGALLGGGIGALFGYKIKSDRWKEITISGK